MNLRDRTPLDDERVNRLQEITHTSVSSAMQCGDLTNIADSVLNNVVEALANTIQLQDYRDVARIIKSLDEKGFFQIRESVNKTAKALGVSRVTVYNHLNSHE